MRARLAEEKEYIINCTNKCRCDTFIDMGEVITNSGLIKNTFFYNNDFELSSKKI